MVMTTPKSSSRAETNFSLKDQLFNPKTVGQLASSVKRVYPEFRAKSFQQRSAAAFADLELKARIDFMANLLRDLLPAAIPDALDVLEAALPEPLNPDLTDNDFGQFIWAVPSQFAATHACAAEHLDQALPFLRECTQRFSVEFAIRPFLNKFPEPSMAFIHACAVDDNYHIRRLSSEGIRPFLPWAERVTLPPATVIEVLDKLHADHTRYVTRSVCNTLNDLSKAEPKLVLNTLKRWHKHKLQTSDELDWMTRHALRSLVKNDNAQALALLGYPPNPKFSVGQIQISEQVKVGGALEWQGRLVSKAKQRLKLVLRVHYLKANGTHAAKTFAFKDLAMTKNQSVALHKRIPLKPMTTRTLYHGEHFVELVVNGVARGKRAFNLNAG